ncbi:hypothetical protein V5O48_007177 [Marasmius crinis-equi]|uniref:F-box domain-containing protein n=1 Tax=Marasmius crinis-equi TaxID=585013 RepID=A0ABR3FHP1_9AGAR
MKKKQKTLKTGVVLPEQKQKGRRKALHHIKDMPLDILYEIFCLLTPYDLLRLSRTSKDLRKILMSRPSLFVWKACRESAGVPDPSPSMSEPAFAQLLFDPHCHFCLTAVVQVISWETMVRCCNKCFDSIFLDEDEIEGDIFDESIIHPAVLWDIFPQYYEPNSGRPVPSGLFLAQPTRAIVREFEALRDDQRKSWLAGKVETCETRSKGIAQYRKWEQQENRKRNRERHMAKIGRFKAIVGKLEESGWSKELRLADVRKTLREHKLVNQTRPLTDRSSSFHDA